MQIRIPFYKIFKTEREFEFYKFTRRHEIELLEGSGYYTFADSKNSKNTKVRWKAVYYPVNKGV